MKKHWKTIILTIIGILILGLAGICFYVPISFGQRQYMEPPEALAIDMQLPKEEVQADRNQMIEYIEHIHPYFLVEENRDAYQSAKDTYISLTEDAMTVGEFQIATGEYLCFFGDGHTGMKWNEEQWLYVPWQYKDNKLFLKMTGKQVRYG